MNKFNKAINLLKDEYIKAIKVKDKHDKAINANLRNPKSVTRNHNYHAAYILFWPVTKFAFLTNIFFVSTIC